MIATSTTEIELKRWAVWDLDGTTNGYRLETYTDTYGRSPSKTSVDDGCFTPGIYRVNPYSVDSGCDGDIKQGEFHAESTSYPYHTHVVAKGSPLVLYLHAGLFSADPSTDNLAQRALQKAYAKVGQSDLSLGEDLGELRETIEMLRNPMKSLRKFLLDDRSRNLRLLKALVSSDKRQVNRLLGRTGKASASAMADTWLELRYGLRPLVMLVQDVIEQVNKKAWKVWDPNKIRSARSRLKETSTKRSSFEDWVRSPAKFSGTVLTTDTVYVNASVQYRQSTRPTNLEELGLAVQYLPEVAWELTGLSFVWDWIFTIGPWLGTLRIKPGIEILGSTLGTKLERKVEMEEAYMAHNWTAAPYTRMDYSDALYRSSYNRVVNPELSYLPHFTFGSTLDLFKVLDSVSLVWSRVIKSRIR